MDLHALDDAQLITVCLNKPADRRCVAELVARHASLVQATIRWVFLRCGRMSREDADDVFQEVFTSLFRDDARTLRRFDPSRAGFRTLLAHIAKNAAINALKRHRRAANVDVDGLESDAPLPDALAETAEERAALAAAVEGLTAKERIFFHLYFEEMMPPEEIARALGIGADTVYSKKAKVVEKLRARITARQQG